MFAKSFFLFLICTALIACKDKPKVIVEDIPTEENSSVSGASDVAGSAQTNSGTGGDVHQVMANEVLQTERYTYLNVSEGGKKFWVATSKTDAKKGMVYLYRGGLLKTNFESKEFNRTFDTIFLVSHIIDANEHPGGNLPQSGGTVSPSVMTETTTSMPLVKDAVSLKNLFADPKKYDGKIITVSGEITKVNNGIMGRNWVHMNDGSKNKGKNIDLTITTQMNIPVGAKVALSGKIVLNKDFGAGYRYDVIMEEAQAVR
ncbi:MAG: SH3-like domain-containing protein [Saprospiraceae bacterium]|nr:SH3-like domain-containing protein [Saprospiraceae bacterium]